MAIEFGILLPFGTERGKPHSFITEIEHYAPMLAGHVQSLWMTDHFFYGDAPTNEAWTTLTYLAAHFPQFHVGSLVLGQRYRNPAMLGKMAATLQLLSGGRLILGMGAGWKEDEHFAYGYDFPSAGDRISQLEEAVIIIKRLWYDENPITYYGRHYRIHDAYCEPKPEPVPPLMIGGSGRKTLRVAAQHANWWNDSAQSPELYKERLNVLYEHCQYLGRHPQDIRLTWLGKISIGKESEAVLSGEPEQIVEQIAPFVELGVDYFILESNQLQNPDAMSLLVNEVLPKIRKLKS